MMLRYKQFMKIMACLSACYFLSGAVNAQAQIPTKSDKLLSIKTVDKKDNSLVNSSYKSIILNWAEIPKAAMYDLEIYDADTKQVVWEKYDVYAVGYQIDSTEIDFKKNLQWRVRGLNIDKVPVSDFSSYKPLDEGRVIDKDWQVNQTNKDADVIQNIEFSKPDRDDYLINNDVSILPIKITTHFEDMAYMPVYPVYSWIPVKNANRYDISVYFVPNKNLVQKKLVATYVSPQNMDFYDTKAYTKAGLYFFKIEAYDINNQKIAESKATYFTVKQNDIQVAALGDSITHGGGAVSTPPSAILYNWETYSQVPVLNIGFSGNLTSNMVERFDQDVLPFKPKFLVIMGGVNDIRTGVSAREVIDNLTKLKEKCKINGITPIFLTVTPVNPPKMKKVANLDISTGWDKERIIVNNWIKNQEYNINVAEALTDARGFLADDLTTDGLHPDYVGKKHIGEMVGDYLVSHFADFK